MAGGSWSSVFFGGFVTYNYLLGQRLLGFNLRAPVKFMLGTPVFLGGFTVGAMVLGEPREFFHLLRNFGTYRKEFNAYKNELYYS